MSEVSLPVKPELFTQKSVIVPFITPKDDGIRVRHSEEGAHHYRAIEEIDEIGIYNLMKLCRDLGAEAGLALGATGECLGIGQIDYEQAARTFVQAGRELNFPVILNVTAETDMQSRERFFLARNLMPGAVLIAPMVGKAMQSMTLSSIEETWGRDAPVYLYENEFMPNVGPIPTEVFERFAKSEKVDFAGIKYSGSSRERMEELLALAEQYNFYVFAGDQDRDPSLDMDNPRFKGIIASGAQLSDVYVRSQQDPMNLDLVTEKRAFTRLYAPGGDRIVAGAKYMLKKMGVIQDIGTFGLTPWIVHTSCGPIDRYLEERGLLGTFEPRVTAMPNLDGIGGGLERSGDRATNLRG